MDYSLTEEQELLAESLERFIRNDYSFEHRQANVRSDLGYSPDDWATFANLGWLALPFGEADGGFDGGASEIMLVMESFGRGLVVEPFVSSVVLAGGALKYGGNSAQRAQYLPGLMDGTSLAALAFVEPQARFNLADVLTRASDTGGGYVIDGSKTVVLNGPAADFFIVPARTSNEPRDHDGISLFIVDATLPEISRRDFPTVDGHRASELTFDRVVVSRDGLLGSEGGGYLLLERVIDDGILAVGSEAVGCMEVLYKDTVEYCKNRKQFGQPIGKFQALQHRMVDMFMEFEQTKSMMYMAATRMDEGYGPFAQRAISAFKVQVGRAGRFVGQNAVQLHGGMGITDELNIGHYFKRLTAIDALFGNVDHHLARFGRL